jgi:hypothetical protein
VKEEILTEKGVIYVRKSTLMGTVPVLEDNNLETFYLVWLDALV